VPWEHAPELIDKLEGLKAEFEQAVEEFLISTRSCGLTGSSNTPTCPTPPIPTPLDLRKKFSFGWHTFKVAGAARRHGRRRHPGRAGQPASCAASSFRR
jgi:hypothetical protein